jgi:hypothetical protein
MKIVNLILPLMVVAFCVAEYVSGNRLPSGARLTVAVFLMVAILWRYQHISPARMTQWVYRKFHRAESASSAMWFAAAYGSGLVCMVPVFRVFHRLARAQDSDVVYASSFSLLAIPAVFASVSIWETSRRGHVMPTTISMAALFVAVATVYYLVVKSGNNDENVVHQSLIGLHGVLILIVVPIIRWWFRRKVCPTAGSTLPKSSVSGR